jgi:hypothetical protein
MATRVGHAAPSSFNRLQSANFIPVKTDKDVRLVSPGEVYFSPKDGGDSPYRAAFTFVDFGDKANVFLRYCGVRSEPSVKGTSSLLTGVSIANHVLQISRDF